MGSVTDHNSWDAETDRIPVPGRHTRRRNPWVRRSRRAALALTTVCVALIGWSVGSALMAPGTDSVAARLAEWGRDHGLGAIITALEQQQYQHDAPRVGGLPPGGIPLADGAAPDPGAPAAIPDLAGGQPLPGEGQWQDVVMVRHRPAVRLAFVRPDPAHTSYLAGVLWMDPGLLRGQLRPGVRDPGGAWPEPTSLTAADQHTVAAAFNSGFRLTNNDSHGGYYSDGRTVVPLVDGAASLVMDHNGVATVGTWNQEVHMTKDVASVRQNLVMLVDNGIVNPTCATGGNAEWGTTVGNTAFVDRSAFGVTASGAEVYVAGPAMSVCTLGNILHAAGVVRGMELDINPDWISGAYFQQGPGPTRGFPLYPAQKLPPSHYFQPSSRDWYAWFTRFDN
jgi:hypothetical protein